MTHSNQTLSPLRQRMIDDMTMRRLNPKTQTAYIRSVRPPEDMAAFSRQCRWA